MWKWTRLAEIPEEQFKAILVDLHAGRIGSLSTDGILRHAGKLSPNRPRPAERARDEALAQLELARPHLEWLVRHLLETGSDEELRRATESVQAVARAALLLEGQEPVKKPRDRRTP
jgi:hypothetical protein